MNKARGGWLVYKARAGVCLWLVLACPFSAYAQSIENIPQAPNGFDPSKTPQVINKIGNAAPPSLDPSQMPAALSKIGEIGVKAADSITPEAREAANRLTRDPASVMGQVPSKVPVIPIEERTNVSAPKIPGNTKLPSTTGASPFPSVQPPRVIPKASAVPDVPGTEESRKNLNGFSVKSADTKPAPPTFEEDKKENIDDILKEMKVLKEQRQAGEGGEDGKDLPEEYRQMMGMDKETPPAKNNGENYKTQYLPEIIYGKEYNKDNMHLPYSINSADLERSLFDAAGQGDINGVRAILDTKIISPDVRNTYGNTPLMNAALHGKVDTVRLLLAREANPNQQNDLGLTALHIAAERGREDIVKALLAMKANPNVKDNYSNTPLMFAAAGKHFATAQALLDGGAVREARFLSELVQNKSQMKSVKYGKPPGDPNFTGEVAEEPNVSPDGIGINRPYEPPPPEPPVTPKPLTGESLASPPTPAQENSVVDRLYGVNPAARPEDLTKPKDASAAEAKKVESAPAPKAPVLTPPPAAKAPELALPKASEGLQDAPSLIPEAKAPTPPPATPLAPSVTEMPKTEAPKPPPLTAPKAGAPATPAPEMKMPEVKAPEVKMPEAMAPEIKAPEVKAPEVKMPEPPAMPPATPPATTPATPSVAPPAPMAAPTPVKPTAPEAPKPVEEKKPATGLPSLSDLPDMPSFTDFVTPEEPKEVKPKVAPVVKDGEVAVPQPVEPNVPALKPKEPPKDESKSVDPDVEGIHSMFKDAATPSGNEEKVPQLGPQIPEELTGTDTPGEPPALEAPKPEEEPAGP